MNEEPLAPEHGFPLRVIVPGYIGAMNNAWQRVKIHLANGRLQETTPSMKASGEP
jgi:DMSO/TMAO reductase YedYZ molybdopterin-dependent catalytic subunit